MAGGAPSSRVMVCKQAVRHLVVRSVPFLDGGYLDPWTTTYSFAWPVSTAVSLHMGALLQPTSCTVIAVRMISSGIVSSR